MAISQSVGEGCPEGYVHRVMRSRLVKVAFALAITYMGCLCLISGWDFVNVGKLLGLFKANIARTPASLHEVSLNQVDFYSSTETLVSRLAS